MSDVFKNIADAAGSSSVRRGFADLFSASKAALDEIQTGLGGILPSMPGMPVAKFGDLSIGIDMHPTVTPPSPIMPVPHVGKVYDRMADLMAGKMCIRDRFIIQPLIRCNSTPVQFLKFTE